MTTMIDQIINKYRTWPEIEISSNFSKVVFGPVVVLWCLALVSSLLASKELAVLFQLVAVFWLMGYSLKMLVIPNKSNPKLWILGVSAIMVAIIIFLLLPEGQHAFPRSK